MNCATTHTFLNFWSFVGWARPPNRKAQPKTSSMLDRIEPRSDCCTTRIMLFFRAKIHIIISVALPKVAFRRPPTAQHKSAYISTQEDLCLTSPKKPHPESSATSEIQVSTTLDTLSGKATLPQFSLHWMILSRSLDLPCRTLRIHC